MSSSEYIYAGIIIISAAIVLFAGLGIILFKLYKNGKL